MAVINTGSFPKFLKEGLNAIWGMAYEEHPEEYTKLFDVFNSSHNYEEDVEEPGFGLASSVGEAGAVPYVGTSQGTISRYSHTEFKLGFIVTRAERDDNLYEKRAAKRTRALAFSFRQTIENIAANVYNRAETAGYTGGDGVVLSSASHPTLNGTQSNRLSVAADISETSIEDLCIQIMNATDTNGLKIALMPQRLIVPTALGPEATRILESQLQNDTANNAVNAIKAMGLIPEIAVNHYLTDTDAFFIKTRGGIEGMKWFWRVKTEFGQDGDFDTDNMKFKGYMRNSAGWSDFRGVYTNGMGA